MEFSFLAAILAANMGIQAVLALAVLWLVFGVLCDSGYNSLFGIISVGAILIIGIEGFTALVTSNPLEILAIFALYVILGVIWSFLRWVLLLLKLKRNGVKEAPLAAEYVGDITFWMAYWPLSIISYLTGTFISDIFKIIWDYVGNAFQKVSDAIFSTK